MTDLVALLDSLVDVSGHILVPGVYDKVDVLTDEEAKLYENIDFDMVSAGPKTETIFRKLIDIC